jgi:hypothetical protein
MPLDIAEISVSHSRDLRVGALKAALGVRRSRGDLGVPPADSAVFGWLGWVSN